jgi:glycosyltransferase involved in cell wall biosynthesis
MNFNLPVLYKKPYVVTIHDMVHHKISGSKKSHFLHFLAYKQVIKNAAKNARVIITVSQNSKSDIVNFLQAQPRKIEVIYEGSSLNLEVSDEKVFEVKQKYLLNKPYFLFVGVLERKKNIVNLTRGFDEFLQKYKLNMDLVIAGSVDRHYPEIKHKALDIKNQNRVKSGFIDRVLNFLMVIKHVVG